MHNVMVRAMGSIRIRVTVGVIDGICGVVQKSIAKQVLVSVLAILFTSIVNNPGKDIMMLKASTGWVWGAGIPLSQK